MSLTASEILDKHTDRCYPSCKHFIPSIDLGNSIHTKEFCGIHGELKNRRKMCKISAQVKLFEEEEGFGKYSVELPFSSKLKFHKAYLESLIK